jgi:16S rRNA (adenine(1408)-N(1))-methyltransferase
VVLDLGTGDGRFVLATAAREPHTLVVGLDADASRMAEASRRAARPPRKGGLPNAFFAVAAAEALPPELDGRADAVTIHFPWGSLLRGVLGAEPWLAAALRRVTKPGAPITALVSVTPRDALADLPALDAASACALTAAWSALGFPAHAAPATPADLAASHSTWAKRLGAGGTRSAWRLCLSWGVD